MKAEDRIFLACVLVLLLYLTAPFFFPQPPKPTSTPPKKSESKVKKEKGEQKAGQPSSPSEKKPEKKPASPTKPEKKPPQPTPEPSRHKKPSVHPPFWIKKEYLQIQFQPKGACIQAVILPKFKNPEKTGPLELIQPYPGPFQPFLLYDYDKLKSLEDEKTKEDPVKKAKDPLASQYWEVLEKGPERVVFRTYFAPKKLWVTKTFVLSGKTPYDIRLKVTFQNGSSEKQVFSYRLNGPSGLSIESEYYLRLEGYLAKYDRKRDFLEVTYQQDYNLASPPFLYQETVENIHWFGVGNKYFAGLVHPEAQASLLAGLGAFPMPRKIGEDPKYNLYSFYVPKTFEIPAGQKVSHQYVLYLGPKDRSLLRQYGNLHFERVVSYGWWIFAIFAELFLAFLRFFYHYIFANYGVAIICLTLLVKLLLFPLDYKAQRSMLLLQKLQPKIKAIQEKYKGKKGQEALQKQHQELMELYHKHGVSPLGGCLPMLIQLPIFIGLYQGLQLDLALRQAPFVAWIQDLSQPDTLVAFSEPIHLFFLTIPGIHVLPILMMVLMFVQQKLQPKSPDPQQEQQRKMFLFMIPLLGLIFYNFPSGLVLYFLCQSLVGIAVQKWILKKLKQEEAQWEA